MDREQYIKENYFSMKISDIAKELNTSEGNVKRIARKIGVKKYSSKPWTDDEIAFLRENFPNKKGKWCAEKLGRSFHATHKKVKDLGIKADWSYEYHDKQGYIVDTSIRNKKQYVHRKVMEDVLGRPLRSDEIVHHIDGDKKNNHPSNLEIVTRSEHINIHRDDLNRNK